MNTTESGRILSRFRSLSKESSLALTLEKAEELDYVLTLLFELTEDAFEGRMYARAS